MGQLKINKKTSSSKGLGGGGPFFLQFWFVGLGGNFSIKKLSFTPKKKVDQERTNFSIFCFSPKRFFFVFVEGFYNLGGAKNPFSPILSLIQKASIFLGAKKKKGGKILKNIGFCKKKKG